MNENGKNGEIPPPLPRENNENSENIPLLRHAPLPECFHSGKGGGALDISAEVFLIVSAFCLFSLKCVCGAGAGLKEGGGNIPLL